MADDEGANRSDDELDALIARLTAVYAQAARDLTIKFNKYMADFQRKDSQKQQDLAAGLITAEEYKSWRLGQILIGHRWQEMIDTMTADLVKVDQFAMAMVSDTSLNVFAVNHNYATFQVEQGSNLNTSYTLYNKDTVAYLVRQQPSLLPLPRVDIPKDQVWNRQHLASAILQGIMQGESIGKIANRVQAVAEMDRKAALRNARTMVTCAQNAGRQAAYERGEKKGIHGLKQWVSAHDERVRKSHLELDGQRVPVDEKFSNGLMFPGDRNGEPSEVYNCRCALAYRVGSVDLKAYVKNKPEEQMSYKQWQAVHEQSHRGSEWNGKQAEDIRVSDRVWTDEYKKAFEKLKESPEVTQSLVNYSRLVLKHRDGTLYEDMFYVDSETNRMLIQKNYNVKQECMPTKVMVDLVTDKPGKVIAVHNHAQSMPPSAADLSSSVKYKYGLIICHDGGIFKYKFQAGANASEIDFLLDRLARVRAKGGDIDPIVAELNSKGLDFEVLL